MDDLEALRRLVRDFRLRNVRLALDVYLWLSVALVLCLEYDAYVVASEGGTAWSVPMFFLGMLPLLPAGYAKLAVQRPGTSPPEAGQLFLHRFLVIGTLVDAAAAFVVAVLGVLSEPSSEELVNVLGGVGVLFALIGLPVAVGIVEVAVPSGIYSPFADNESAEFQGLVHQPRDLGEVGRPERQTWLERFQAATLLRLVCLASDPDPRARWNVAASLGAQPIEVWGVGCSSADGGDLAAEARRRVDEYLQAAARTGIDSLGGGLKALLEDLRRKDLLSEHRVQVVLGAVQEALDSLGSGGGAGPRGAE